LISILWRRFTYCHRNKKSYWCIHKLEF